MIEEREVRLLADADPAQDLLPAPPDDLLALIVGSPRPRESGKRTHRPIVRAVCALGVVLVAVAAVLAFADSRGSESVALAARAYAQTSTSPGQILHTLATTRQTVTTAGRVQLRTGTIEEWHRGRENHRVETYFSARGYKISASERVTDASGVIRWANEHGSRRITRKSDSADAANVVAEDQSGFVANFRHLYERGELDQAGDVRFAGRPARRYTVSAEANRAHVVNADGSPYPAVGPLGPEQAFYIDRKTAQPLGYTSIWKMGASDSMRWVETVRIIERLKPTHKNLLKLRTLSLRRR